MSFSIDGIVSGFNTASIIDGLVAIQQRQVDQLATRRTGIVQRQTAFNTIETRLATLRSTMSRLNRTVGAVFDARQAGSSNESLVDVAASSGAQPGSFTLKVNSLASAHQIASQGFQSTSDSITTGTVEISTGDRTAEVITVDQSNNTLEGLANAINIQSSQVSASIIRDAGSGSYRLLLSSKQSGTDNEIRITNNLAADDAGAIRPDLENQIVQAATNASVTFGSGAGAISAEYQTNRVDNLVPGVTLNLLGADPDSPVTISVSEDTGAVSSAVQAFVDEYNSLIRFINDQTAYNAESGAAGLLLGNRAVQNIRTTLEGIVTGTVEGATGSLSRFSQLGIQIGDRGTLTFDEGKLTRILENREPGISSRDVQALFGLSAVSSNSGIQFVLGSARTKATTNPVEIDITQAATRASVIGDNSIAGPIVIDGSNDEFSIKLDGKESDTIRLGHGTYSISELATHLQSVINNSSSLAGRQVTVSENGGRLTIVSQSWGKASTISDIGGSALTSLGFSGNESGEGQDVAGRFIVDGQIEEAKGTGRILAGLSDNENTADLQVRVSLTDAQIGGSSEGTLTLSRGITASLDKIISGMVDPANGSLTIAKKQFEDQIANINDSIARVENVTRSRRDALQLQFANLERVLGQLQSTSSVITGQLASLGSFGR